MPPRGWLLLSFVLALSVPASATADPCKWGVDQATHKCAPPPAGMIPYPPSLTVTPVPIEAEVLDGGRSLGTGIKKITRQGPHTLTFRRAGYEDTVIDRNVNTPNQTETVELARLPTILARLGPGCERLEGATLSLDGSTIDPSTDAHIPVSVGIHEVRVDAPHYFAERLGVETESRKKTSNFVSDGDSDVPSDRVVTLCPAPHPGSLAVGPVFKENASPRDLIGVEVQLDGKPEKWITPVIIPNVQAGAVHRLTVRIRGFSSEILVQVDPDELKAVRVRMPSIVLGPAIGEKDSKKLEQQCSAPWFATPNARACELLAYYHYSNNELAAALNTYDSACNLGADTGCLAAASMRRGLGASDPEASARWHKDTVALCAKYGPGEPNRSLDLSNDRAIDASEVGSNVYSLACLYAYTAAWDGLVADGLSKSESVPESSRAFSALEISLHSMFTTAPSNLEVGVGVGGIVDPDGFFGNWMSLYVNLHEIGRGTAVVTSADGPTRVIGAFGLGVTGGFMFLYPRLPFFLRTTAEANAMFTNYPNVVGFEASAGLKLHKFAVVEGGLYYGMMATDRRSVTLENGSDSKNLFFTQFRPAVILRYSLNLNL